MANICFICGLEKMIVFNSIHLFLLSYFSLKRMVKDGKNISKLNIIYEIIYIIFIMFRIKSHHCGMESKHL